MFITRHITTAKASNTGFFLTLSDPVAFVTTITLVYFLRLSGMISIIPLATI